MRHLIEARFLSRAPNLYAILFENFAMYPPMRSAAHGNGQKPAVMIVVESDLHRTLLVGGRRGTRTRVKALMRGWHYPIVLDALNWSGWQASILQPFASEARKLYRAELHPRYPVSKVARLASAATPRPSG